MLSTGAITDLHDLVRDQGKLRERGPLEPEEIVQMSVEGEALVDAFKPSGGGLSQIFKIVKI